MSPELWNLRIGALLLVAIIPLALADDVYRTVDAQGHVTYSDKPLSPASKKMSVDVIAANPQEASRLARERALVSADTAQQAKLSAQQATEQQKQAEQAAVQERKCEAARSRYAMFVAGGRIYKVDETGSRVFYSDEEIDAQRIATKTAMDSACTR